MSLAPIPPTSGTAGTAKAIRSRIVEWDARRGFGYVEQGGMRLFLHQRDFIRRGHSPRKGDTVSFVMGVDEKGRPCARAVEPLHSMGFPRPRDVAGLLPLVLLPAFALGALPWSPWLTAIYVAAISLLSYRQYRVDKLRSRSGAWRIPESSLHLLDFAGGWPGGYLAQRQFRHKTAKGSFRRVFWGTVLTHEAVALDFLLGWPGSRWLGARLSELLSNLPA